MHQALYRKYRPTVFDDVSGQEHITSILRYEALHGSVSHAYLFAGSRGTGKTTCAKILAKVVNCLDPIDGNPCNECENCLAIDSGTATDVVEMDAATNTGVDYIRDLRDSVMYTPAMLKKRVYIIDEAHMLSDSAFNALLKTIEEPPDHVLYIFATTEPHKIPATIISRCQRFEFRRISISDLSERLMYIASEEGIDLSEEGSALIAKTAQGGMRDAISLMELCAGSHKHISAELVNEILGTSPYEKMCDVATAIANKNYAMIFKIINDIVISSKDLLVFFSDLTSFYRDMTVQKSSGTSDYLDLSQQEYKQLCEVSAMFDMATLLYHSRLIDEAYTNMMRNPTGKRLTAELTLMKMCDSKLSTSTDALLARITALENKLALISKGVTPTEDSPKQAENKPISTDSKDITKVKSVKQEIKQAPIQPLAVRIDNWNEIIAKVGESDHAVESFLKSCKCSFNEADGTYRVVSAHKLMATMLDSPKNKRVLFDAMVCCEMDIDSPEQIKISFEDNKVQNSDLDEF
ncbi:MAG: DNA polymerase III subunit gamma/tau [Clostridia bacterium]|nr:DNA polymerase III subunit gamma/tau [Clostridia bacterium]